MVQKTVLKVKLSCQKCKKRILTSITGLQGIDKIEIDPAKETLTVTGDADPYCVIIQARKIIKCIEVVTIGPPPSVKNPEEKKPDTKKPSEDKKPDIVFVPSCIPMPKTCVACPQVAVVHMKEDPCYTACSIM
uniref:heavy metal-associated isoprenylated plant protein 2-like n=1 Tax=Erigeron canadensis TaxID=72917 RepID=UPI001CB94A09|nr:heavy metal-associated isoprenylated plant protein 2-like [Erigeron canadensis]